MEFRQLEHFVAVAEHRHFTRAAGALHIAQSGLSASIRALERDLGCDLFIRNTRSVELTDAGRALLAEARHTLHSVISARDAVAAVHGLLRGRLVVGTIQCLTAVDVPDLLLRFHTRHPGVEIGLRQGGSEDLLDRVRSGEVDVAFVGASHPESSDITLTELSSEPIVLACGPAHRYADAGQIDIADLSDQTFVDFHPGWISRDVTDRALAFRHLDRRVALEVNDAHLLLDLVSAGLGIALVPASFRGKRTTARFVRLRPPAPEWRTVIVTATGRRPSAAAQALLADEALAQSSARSSECTTSRW